MKRPVLFGTLLIATVLGSSCSKDNHTPTALAESNPAFSTKSTGGKVNNPRATFTYYSPGSSSGIFGDGRAADGSFSGTAGESVYDDGKCGVTAEIFANRTGDATMDPIGTTLSRKTCPGYANGARSLTVKLGAPLAGASVVDLPGGHFTSVREVLALTNVGDTGERVFTLFLGGTHTCERIRYDDGDGVTYGGVAGRKIKVMRISSRAAGGAEDAWIAESQPNADGQHVAFCQVGGDKDNPGTLLGAYDIPFRIKVVQK